MIFVARTQKQKNSGKEICLRKSELWYLPGTIHGMERKSELWYLPWTIHGMERKSELWYLPWTNIHGMQRKSELWYLPSTIHGMQRKSELWYLPWTIIHGMQRKEILDSLLNNFLIPAFKIYLYVRHPSNGLYLMQINHKFTREAGLNCNILPSRLCWL